MSKVTPSSILNPAGPDECPKCLSTRITAARVVRDGEVWRNCYVCEHAWHLNKPPRAHHRKSKPSWSPKMVKE